MNLFNNSDRELTKWSDNNSISCQCTSDGFCEVAQYTGCKKPSSITQTKCRLPEQKSKDRSRMQRQVSTRQGETIQKVRSMYINILFLGIERYIVFSWKRNPNLCTWKWHYLEHLYMLVWPRKNLFISKSIQWVYPCMLILGRHLPTYCIRVCYLE